MLNGAKLNIKAGGSFDPVPADKYTLQVLDVSLVTQFNKFKGEEQEVLNYQFGILDDKEMPKGSSQPSTRGKYLWKRCSQSLNTKSWLYKLALAVDGKAPDVATFDPESLVGKQVGAMVNEKESQDGGAVYNNILEFMKVSKKLPELEAKANSEVVEKSSQPIEDIDPELVIESLEEEDKS